MKVIELHAENFKRLKAVTIRPGENNVVEISGRNAQGKSSAIDAIWAALQGAKALKGTSQPVRKGAKKTEIRVDLGRYVVTRNWTETGKSYLTVTTGSGADEAKVKSPQKLLDGLIGDLAFDPLAFTRLSEKDQAQTVLDLLKIDLTALDAKKDNAYQERTLVNRDINRVKVELDALPPADRTAPAQKISVADLMAQLDEAAQITQSINVHRLSVEKYEFELRAAEQALENAMERVDYSKTMLADAKEKAAGLVYPDTESIRERIDSAEVINKAIDINHKRSEVSTRLTHLTKQTDALTAEIGSTYEAKQAALVKCAMPVKGLYFDLDSGMLTFNGVPFRQASRSEQLRVAVGMSMAQHPELRVMRIEDASVLDTDAMAMLKEMAAANDYQLWLEVVDESGKVGVVIEDGEVAANNLDSEDQELVFGDEVTK